MSRAKILLVEGEEDAMLINEKYLTLHGYEVYKAHSGKAAYDATVNITPHLIILDTVLPDASGIDLCKKIRGITTAPILFLSCEAESKDKIEGLLSGGDDYITKPYDMDELGARVAAHLRRTALNNIQRIDLPPLSLNLATGRAYINGVDTCLSIKEFSLLLTLVKHRGQELTNKQLYKMVWGESFYTDSGTIRVHIHGIRKKLGLTDESRIQIKLCHNGAYCFSIQDSYSKPTK